MSKAIKELEMKKREEERKKLMLKYYAPPTTPPYAPPLFPPIKKGSSNPDRTAKETMTLAGVQEAFTTALKQVTSTTEQRVANQEFWHSLNRKLIIRNDEVQPLIDLTLMGLKKR